MSIKALVIADEGDILVRGNEPSELNEEIVEPPNS
jgi:hypothetical protein